MNGIAAGCGALWLAVGSAWAVPDGTPVKRVLNTGTAAVPPLAAEAAKPYGKGFVRDGEVYVCDNGRDAHARRGVVWTLDLNQTSAAPVVASAWAKPEGQEGTQDSDFSLYLDLVYADGTPLWGQSASFETDAGAGWHRREVVVVPDKPIRRASCYLLFRSHAGRALFREPRFGALNSEGTMRFDGIVCGQAAPAAEGFLVRDAAAGSDFVSIAERRSACG
jgi:hypothetical protein